MAAGGASPDEAAVRFFQALGDPTRLRLLQELKAAPRTVGELVDTLGCPQPKVSRHLKVLKEAGLVADHREGRHVTYATTRRRTWPSEAKRWLDRLDAGPAVGIDLVDRESAPPAPPRRPSPPRPRPAAVPPASSRRRSDLDTHLL